jgi:small subunit ribosomal protein S1
MESSNPAPQTSSSAPETPATEPQTDAQPAAPAAEANKGPNLKGLPKVGRAEVINEDGRPVRPGPGGPGGRGGDRGPGGRGGFGRGKPSGPESGRADVPDTMGMLRNVNDEAKKGGALGDPSLDAEIEAMMQDAGDAVGTTATPPRKRPGQQSVGRPAPATLRGPRKVESGREHRKGKVVSVGPTDIFIEFGPKELGVVPRANYERQGEQGQEDASVMPKPGDELEVVVDRFEKDEGLFICSRPGQIVKAAWELLEVGQTVEARVTGVNKGGLELEVANHRAFMPAGQVSLDRVADLSVFIGEKFPCEIVQIDHRGAGNIVLSRRNMLKQEREEKAAKLKETLVEGAVMDGIVRKIMPFGAFVDIGGMDGLVHISDMTYDRVSPSEKNVAKFVKEGESVKVQVLKLDAESGKIALGMKQLASDPFSTAVADVTEGAEVSGAVVRITDFGAFIQIGPGVDGLVHISEISRKRIGKVEDELKVGQVVSAKVLKIDPTTRKISLSIKALLPEVAPAPGSREAMMADKRNDRNKRDQERLAEINKETPELRRKREQFRNKELSGGFGKNTGFMGSGLGDLKLGR